MSAAILSYLTRTKGLSIASPMPHNKGDHRDCHLPQSKRLSGHGALCDVVVGTESDTPQTELLTSTPYENGALFLHARSAVRRGIRKGQLLHEYAQPTRANFYTNLNKKWRELGVGPFMSQLLQCHLLYHDAVRVQHGAVQMHSSTTLGSCKCPAW